jgi:3-oxoacyl-[acyl-carrier protein] reductase
MDMDVKDRVVVVTGGASGIGLETARLFLQAGARIAIMDIQEDAIESALSDLGGDVLGVPCNVADEASVEAAFDKVVDHFGQLDVAVLNAGILRDGLLIKVNRDSGKVKGKMSLDQWQSVIDVNLTGVFLTGREAAIRMINTGRKGVMVLISSIAKRGNMGQTNYSAAKAGVETLAVVWGKELARAGIRVASVSPGFIATPMVMKDMKPEMLDRFRKMIPVGRLGKPEEIAHAIKFVVSNDLICATDIEPSGGMRL